MTDAVSELPKRRWGTSDLLVPALCVGCAPLGGMPGVMGYSVPEGQALATVRAAFASPISYLDTANAYGASERRIGVVLREHSGLPPGFVLATKVGSDPASRNLDGERVKRSVENSMALLGLDRLQIVLLHDPEYSGDSFERITGPGGALEMLLRYKEQGAIGHVGVAAGPVALLARYMETGAFEAVLTHNRYTLLNRAASPLIDAAAQRGMAVLNAAPYGGGMLAKGPEASTRYAYREAPTHLRERAERMATICAEHGVPLQAAALQFSLRDPRITSTLVGMSHPDRIAQTLELARHPIPAALWAQLDEVGFDTDDLA